MRVRNRTPDLRLVLHASKQRDVEGDFLLANKPSLDLWTTALSSSTGLRSSTEYCRFLERKLETTEDNWMYGVRFEDSHD